MTKPAVSSTNVRKNRPSKIKPGQSVISRELLDLWPDCLFILSPDCRIVAVNRKAEACLNGPVDSIFFDLCPPDRSEELKTLVEECLRSGEPKSIETKLIPGSGDATDVLLSMNRYPGAHYCLISARDISEEKRKELDLLRFTNVAHFTVNPIEITDPAGKIIYVNPAFLKVSGFSGEELIGKNPNVFGSGKYPKSFWKAMWSTINAGNVWVGEIENRKKNGEPFFTHLLISPIIDAEGKVIGYFGVHRDITHQKHLEHQLVHAQKMESIGLLAAGIAHEVGNPLASISSIVQVLQREDHDDFTQDKLELIKSQVTRISRIIRDLVDFSRRSSYEVQLTDINKGIRGAVEIVRVGKKAKEIAFSLDLDETLPRLPLVPDQVEQVFINILINAVDAISARPNLGPAGRTPKRGEITVRSYRGEATLMASVQDNGKGISEDTRPKIFEPFFTTKKVGEGTGLGLWVSYGIIKSFQGNITVESVDGEGTTFTITLPLHPEIFIGIESIMADRILVVDDERIIRESIAFVLKKEGYSVAEAANGKEALEKFVAETFDLVITDLEMPEMKGLELLDGVVHINPQSLVVIITAYGSLDTAIAALRKGASDYILKPIEFDELLVKIQRLLEHRKLIMENQFLRRELHREYDFTKMVGKSPAMQMVFETIQTVSPTDSTVLIAGKSGTGKELVARALHFNSPRADKAFITVNCGAIPETLIESELFGHKKGSFTGASSDKTGFFKAADGGTLFLDEISEMPIHLQVKILRAIEQKEIIPVGTSYPLIVDVRIVASTNRDLQAEVEAGRFRQDLYYRLNVVQVQLPSLSERRADIPLLVEHFVDKYTRQMRKNIQGAKKDVMLLLMQHEWKGEIRELENIIERAVIFCKENFITLQDLPDFLHAESEVQENSTSLEGAMGEFEKQYILSVLRRYNFEKEKTAQDLQVSLPTLYRRIKDLGIKQ